MSHADLKQQETISVSFLGNIQRGFPGAPGQQEASFTPGSHNTPLTGFTCVSIHLLKNTVLLSGSLTRKAAMFSCELDRYLELFTGPVWSSLLLLAPLPYQPCVCELLNCSAVSSSASTGQLSLLGLAFGPYCSTANTCGI